GFKSTERQLECKLKTSIGSSQCYHKRIYIFFTFVSLASLFLLLYYFYQSGFNMKKMDIRYFSTSISIFLMKGSQLKSLEIETKLLVKKAVEDVSYKKLTDLLRKYDPSNSLLDDNIEKKTNTFSEKPKKQSPRASPSPTPFPTFANRSITDKIVDKLIGDNPHDRYALICSSCHVHNGLMPPNNMAHFGTLIRLRKVYKCYMCQENNTIEQFPPDSNNSTTKLEQKPTINEDSLSREDQEIHKTKLD
ncbi:hypothetical protein MXB_5064, partial [Myxobolus squamalis]